MIRNHLLLSTLTLVGALVGCQKPTDDVGIATQELIRLDDFMVNGQPNIQDYCQALLEEGVELDQYCLASAPNLQDNTLDHDNMITELAQPLNPAASPDCWIQDSCGGRECTDAFKKTCNDKAGHQYADAHGADGSVIGGNCWVCTEP